MSDSGNYGFQGPAPSGASVEANVQRAQEYQSTHTPKETYDWFFESVRNNKDGHLPADVSMDYKQIDPSYADFGNYNYAVVGKALGFPDWVLKSGAGWAQGKADGLDNVDAIIKSILDPANRGDAPEDQYQIWKGINDANNAGISKSDLGLIDYIQGAFGQAFGVMKDNLWAAIKVLNPELCDLFLRARTFIQRRDPLAFDLDGDGLETTGIIASQTTLFDHDGDGIRTGTGWLKGDDGFLALDRNGNGTIDNGSELFGVDTVLANGPNAGLKARSGFEALADLDSNGDHLFDAQDAAYGNVRMWRDLNQDGISQAEELQTLADAGIASINLNATTTNITLTGGNVLYGMAGNVGDDAYVVDSLADTVLELSGQGTDTVMGPKHFLDAANESNWRSVKCA